MKDRPKLGLLVFIFIPISILPRVYSGEILWWLLKHFFFKRLLVNFGLTERWVIGAVLGFILQILAVKTIVILLFKYKLLGIWRRNSNDFLTAWVCRWNPVYLVLYIYLRFVDPAARQTPPVIVIQNSHDGGRLSKVRVVLLLQGSPPLLRMISNPAILRRVCWLLKLRINSFFPGLGGRSQVFFAPWSRSRSLQKFAGSPDLVLKTRD